MNGAAPAPQQHVRMDVDGEIPKIEARFGEINEVLGDGPREDWMRPLEEEFAFLRGRLSILRPEGTPLQTHVKGKEQPLDWSNFEGPKRNVEWKPDDQDLIYTALNYRDDEFGDQDEDAGQQIVERLLAAWRSSVISEQLTFEISARLLKERDEVRATLASTPAPQANVERITLSKAEIDAMLRGKLPAHKSDAYATAEAAFADYFARNYPGPDTVIFNPAWHAPKLFYAAFRALAATPDGATDA